MYDRVLAESLKRGEVYHIKNKDELAGKARILGAAPVSPQTNSIVRYCHSARKPLGEMDGPAFFGENVTVLRHSR